MALGMALLQPGSLYITLAIPPLRPYEPLAADAYPPHLPDDFDPTEYETNIAEGRGREEFDWGLYWLHDDGCGLWYTLQGKGTWCEATSSRSTTTSSSSRCSRSVAVVAVPPSSLRLNPNIVGILRVLALPPGAYHDGVPRYLGWLTARAAPAATRSFLWAATAYLRFRKHVAHAHAHAAADVDWTGVPEFDINEFLCEALAFGYQEVWHCLVGGQLPRPVATSGFGVELQVVAGDDGE